ncbi:hypothetical protein [Streptomyces hesseae]|uniref:Uncharacterized protein n=1 Tax=Streptomyces hesseae TaxID=3075519 RepID=A0ABU2SXS6_9ACTN|nr:hypothetical protein [Streptomyces sp. DSM 40473]MDT0453756.1 hypothetical protein [Streptomyces sp. DSM 40473]
MSESWEILADGLHYQRIYLHLDQWRNAADLDAAACGLPESLIPRELVTRPAPPPAHAVPVAEDAGLSTWLSAPQQLGLDGPGSGALAPPARGIARTLTAGIGDKATEDAVEAVCAAAAWWVGVLAIIRHKRGAKAAPAPLGDDGAPVNVIEEAAKAVALGVATRILRARLRSAGASEAGLRMAYCRAVTEGIIVEPKMPGLLAALGDLRLFDLVSTSLPWRGRFTKYAGGTGAGQVE